MALLVWMAGCAPPLDAQRRYTAWYESAARRVHTRAEMAALDAVDACWSRFHDRYEAAEAMGYPGMSGSAARALGDLSVDPWRAARRLCPDLAP